MRTGTVRELMEEVQRENIVQFTVAGGISGLKHTFGHPGDLARCDAVSTRNIKKKWIH